MPLPCNTEHFAAVADVQLAVLHNVDPICAVPDTSAVPKLKPSAVSNAPPDAAALYGITDVTIGASYENARGSVPMACATVTAVWSWPAAPRGTEQRSVVVEMKVVVWHVPANPSYPLTSYRLF